jgi:general secretion pathway protein A
MATATTTGAMMFTSFFKMTAHPFPAKPPQEAIFRDERFQQGQARLEFLSQQAHLALITGEEGVGKTVLIRRFIESIQPQCVHTIYVHLASLTPVAFLRVLAGAWGEQPRQYKDQILLQIIHKLNTLKSTTLLFIDDAHLLDAQALVDLRLLISTPFDQDDALKLVLIGHYDLKQQLKRSIHTSLAQGVNLCDHLPAFSPRQTHAYLDFQMRRVGSSDKIFETEVKQEIHQYTRGIPRLINNLATACLINAATQNRQKVDLGIFRQTVREFPLYS